MKYYTILKGVLLMKRVLKWLWVVVFEFGLLVPFKIAFTGLAIIALAVVALCLRVSPREAISPFFKGMREGFTEMMTWAKA
jgi:hypothetical protein